MRHQYCHVVVRGVRLAYIEREAVGGQNASPILLLHALLATAETLTELIAGLPPDRRIVAIDLADSRLQSALQFGADTIINNGHEDARAQIMELTDGLGADVAFEAVGVPDTFELACELIRPGGRVANIGVHGHPATLHLERLWTRDVTITTGLVDTYTIPRLLKLVISGRLDPTVFATHHFALEDTMAAYDTFADASKTAALKVVLQGSETAHAIDGRVAAGALA